MTEQERNTQYGRITPIRMIGAIDWSCDGLLYSMDEKSRVEPPIEIVGTD